MLNMRKLLFATTFLIASSSLSASALTAAVVPGREPPTAIQQQVNPGPFNTRTPVPPPIVVPAPQVTVAAPEQNSIQSWLLTAFMGLIASVFGVKSFSGGSKVDLKEFLQSSEFRSILDQAAIRAINSGVPGQLIGQIPGVNAIEPLIRQLALKVLNERLASSGIDATAQASTAATPLINALETLMSRVERISDALTSLKDKKPQ